MSTPLLSTKFYVPEVSENLVERPHLLQKLDAGLHKGCLLTLVSAPAGYGKTTLVSNWLHTLTQVHPGERSGPEEEPGLIPYAWLTLDSGEEDLARFLTYLVTALRRISPKAGEDMLATLHIRRPSSAHKLSTLLINDLATFPDRFILVLDDYQTIKSQPVHDFLAFLVDHQPPNMCLVIVSRADPPLALVRLRARGQLVEIRQDDLSFNPTEISEFVSRTIGLKLSPEQLAALEKRTEGWAAGIQLAALSMRSVQNISSFIEALSGEHEHIADYLTGEVLAQQPAAIQSFLLQTSILDRLSAPLCEAVAGQTSSQDIIEQLKEANLFVVSLDHRQYWHRYHALFADLLRKRLYETQSGAVAELHRRASRWFQENEMIAPAVEHAFSAEDYQRAAELIVQGAESLFFRSETITLLRWLEALPLNMKLAQPILFVFYGLALMMTGKPLGPAKHYLDEIAASGSAEEIQGEVATIRALSAMMEANTTEAIRLSEHALERLPSGRFYYRSLAADCLGMAYTMLGDTAAATKAFEQVVDITSQSGDVIMNITVLSNLAGMRFMMGQLHAAAASYQQVLDLASERLGDRSLTTGKALLGLGELAREWNDLEGALRYYFDAAVVLEKSVEIGLPIVFLSVARVKATQGDWKSAQYYLEKARLYAQESTTTPIDDRITEGLQVRFWIARGELELATHWAQEHGLLELPIGKAIALREQDTAPNEFVLTDHLTLARLFLARKQPDQALKVLDPLLGIYERKAHMRRVIEVLALKAIALRQRNDHDTALKVLDHALTLAKPEGYQRTFLDEGEQMAKILYELATRGDSATFTRKLLAAFADELSRPVTGDEQVLAEGLVEPLSERELDVLALIAAGLSNREIAGRLCISASTVKGHTANIYGKLNVSSRTQAVARARSLGLLHAS